MFTLFDLGSRKTQSTKASVSQVKFCSDRCKRNKLRPIDHQIEATFAALLDGQAIQQGEKGTEIPPVSVPKQAASRNKQKKTKGDPRILVLCSEVETLVFGSRVDPEKTFGRKKNRARRGVPDQEVWKSVDMEGSDTDSGSESSTIVTQDDEDTTHSALTTAELQAGELPFDRLGGGVSLRVRPPQSKSDVNGSIGGEKGWAERIEETPEMVLKRREGQKRAEQREMVRCAARRAVVFGLLRQSESRGYDRKTEDAPDQPGEKKLCEAVANSSVVEPSYAKGDWGVRWREE